MEYTVRPLSDTTWLNAAARVPSRFTASWTDTLDLLARELKALDGRRVVFEIDVREGDVRRDGMLRANAKAEHPPVIIAFESKFGPLMYRADRFNSKPYGSDGVRVMPHLWQHNVRAVALTLAALRAVDRYGATQSGEQYRGFRAIEAGKGLPPSGMTASEAMTILYEATGIAGAAGLSAQQLVRLARRNTHPDVRDGDSREWDKVEQAIGVARRAGVL